MHKMYMEVFSQFPGVRGFFATKYGACEGAPYYRRDVFQSMGIENMQMIQPVQVHKDRIAVIEKKGSGSVQLPGTDGMITCIRGVLLTTVHADCLPVYFFDPKKRAIGLVHAGWRGTVAGIAPAAVTSMQQVYGSCPEDIQVYIGPGIGACCFETGGEVAEEFQRKWDFARELPRAFFHKKGEKYFIDLKAINRKQLMDKGIKEEAICTSRHCTCCEEELFCSYRREDGTYLRMGAGLCLV